MAYPHFVPHSWQRGAAVFWPRPWSIVSKWRDRKNDGIDRNCHTERTEVPLQSVAVEQLSIGFRIDVGRAVAMRAFLLPIWEDAIPIRRVLIDLAEG